MRWRMLRPAVVGSSPSTLSLPPLRGVRPSTRLMKVVLPAPFDPSSPVMPWGTLMDTFVSTWVSPKLFVTAVASMTFDALVVAPAGEALCGAVPAGSVAVIGTFAANYSSRHVPEMPQTPPMGDAAEKFSGTFANECHFLVGAGS